VSEILHQVQFQSSFKAVLAVSHWIGRWHLSILTALL
jgi:hypothetical protein